MSRSDQIALPLDWPQGGDAARFIESAANREAIDHLDRWHMWPVKAGILTGPRRSGRSLLARRFVAQTGGRLFDDAEQHDEEEIFHAWNRAQEEGKPLLLVADRIAPDWTPQLPDLRTRLAVTPFVAIGQPDDDLLQKLLYLLFSDRGLHLPADAQAYLATRIERSYYAAEQMVDEIDRYAIATGSRLTLPTVRKALMALETRRGAA